MAWKISSFKTNNDLSIGDMSTIVSQENFITDVGGDINIPTFLKSNINTAFNAKGGIKTAGGGPINILSSKKLLINTNDKLDLNHSNITAESLSLESKEGIDAEQSFLNTFGKAAEPNTGGKKLLSAINVKTPPSQKETDQTSLGKMMALAKKIKGNSVKKFAKNGELKMFTEGDIDLKAANLEANVQFDIEAEGHIDLGSKINKTVSESGNPWKSVKVTRLEHQGASLTAGSGLSRIKSGKKITMSATNIKTDGHLEMDAEEGIDIVSKKNTTETETNEIKAFFGYNRGFKGIEFYNAKARTQSKMKLDPPYKPAVIWRSSQKEMRVSMGRTLKLGII